MTVILGKICKKEHCVKFMGDSMVSNGRYDIVTNINKLIKSNGFTIAAAGSFANYQLLKNRVTFPTDEQLKQENIEVNAAFMSNYILPALKEVLKEGKYGYEIQLLIGYKEKLFRVVELVEVFEVENFASIGVAQDTVASYMDVSNEDCENQKMFNAMKYGISKKMGCGFPLYYTTTNMQDFIRIDENGNETCCQEDKLW